MKHPLNTVTEAGERLFHRLAHHFFRRWPRPRPPADRLRSCRIVAHRGAHKGRERLENTLAAFDAAAVSGVWGIELDIRWTMDGVPVVFHDPDTLRLFGEDIRIDAMPAADLRKRFPLIPTIDEVVTRYGGRQHLMIEIKHADRPDPDGRARHLKRSLAGLVPGRDFHLMALDPDLFDPFEDLPPAALIPIARVRIERLSGLAIQKGWAGLAGHYLPITRRRIARHHRRGQRIGTGFADSPRCLFREVSRGVDWVFTNRAAEIQKVRDAG